MMFVCLFFLKTIRLKKINLRRAVQKGLRIVPRGSASLCPSRLTVSCFSIVFSLLNRHIFAQMSKIMFQKNLLGFRRIESRCLFGNHQAESPARPSVP